MELTPSQLQTKHTIREFELGEGQMKAFNSPARFIAMVAGIQSGKSFTGAVWMMNQVDMYPNDEHLILASTYKVLNQATLKKFEDMLPKGWLKKVKSPDEFYYQILPNKSLGRTGKGRIWVRSAENPNKIEGMTIRSCWFDEAGDAPELAFTNVQGRLSILQGKCLITSTPYTWNWLKEFEEKWRKDTANGTRPGKLSYDYINYPSYQNPMFPMEEYERARISMPQHEFERRYLGLFTRPEGLIYQNFNADLMVKSLQDFASVTESDPLKDVIAGVDWGYRDATVIMVIGITKGGTYWVLDEWYGTEQENSAIADAALGLKKKWNIGYFYADSAYPQSVRAFNSKNIVTIPVKKTKNAQTTTYIKEGIGKIRQLMSESKWYVLDTCENTIKEYGRYRYKTKLLNGVKIVIDEPNDSDSHTMDATRYAVDTHMFIPDENIQVVKHEYNRLDTIFKRIEESEFGETEIDYDSYNDDYLYL